FGGGGASSTSDLSSGDRSNGRKEAVFPNSGSLIGEELQVRRSQRRRASIPISGDLGLG
ncbi:hypothetical protein U1Q18_011681, partial [Sarracenia purpurea var. burkii]